MSKAHFILITILFLVLSCSEKPKTKENKDEVAAEAVEEVAEPKFKNKRNLLQKNAEDLGLKDSLPKSFDEIQQQIQNTPPLTEEEHKKADSIIQSRKVVLGKSQLGQKAEIDKNLDSLKNEISRNKEYQEFLKENQAIQNANLKDKLKPTNSNKTIQKDISLWEAFKESYLQNILILIAVLVGLFLLQLIFRLVIKSFKRLKRIDYSNVYNRGKVSFSQKISQLKLKDLDKKEIIIISIVVGTFIALILGYLFGETKYLIAKGLVVSEDVFYEREYRRYLNKYFNFNYIVAIALFIISSGLTYLYLSRKKVE